MEEYARILNFAIPGFIALIFLEYLVGRRKGILTIRSLDTISSLSSGMTNVIKDVLGLTITIISYTWFYDHLALFSITSTYFIYALAFVGLDFAGYWSHRLEHVVNVFWNRHIIHHSSEEFNLACALRQNVSAFFAIFTFLFIPMAIMGIPPKVVAIVAPLHLFAQFWYHTTLIGKMGWLEKVIVTPSHHRVHHAINSQYLDKNFSQIFIVWDKLFGTFQEELQDVPPVYGVKRAVRTWNPILINFQHLWLLLKDAWHTASTADKLRIWFMPTGWRPSDVEAAYPVSIITDPYQIQKYDSVLSSRWVVWSWIQLIINLSLMILFFGELGNYPFPQLLLGAVYLFISIYAFTSLMDQSIQAMAAEVLRMIWTLVMGYFMGSWFGYSMILFTAYGMISLCLTAMFFYRSKRVSEVASV